MMPAGIIIIRSELKTAVACRCILFLGVQTQTTTAKREARGRKQPQETPRSSTAINMKRYMLCVDRVSLTGGQCIPTSSTYNVHHYLMRAGVSTSRSATAVAPGLLLRQCLLISLRTATAERGRGWGPSDGSNE
jgi:hypothetical protein